MATMRDVAQRAGVSLPTVSYVVNNGPRPVSEATRTLARRNTRAIGLIIPNSSDLFFARLAQAIEEVAFHQGFNLFLCNTHQNLQRELDHFSSLVEKKIDGILLVTCGIQPDQLAQAAGVNLPVVIVDREIEGAYYDTFVFDNYSAGRQAAEHILSHGHSRVACIAGPKSLKGSRERVAGCLDALHKAGIEVPGKWLCWSDYTFEGGFTTAKKILTNQDQPNAIIACNDEMGVAVIHAARNAHLRVPSDLAVMGISDSFIGQVCIPQLTTISGSLEEMGKRAAEALLARVNGTAPLASGRQVLETSLQVRESCGCHREEVA
jgi:LacI family transcriptional regulator